MHSTERHTLIILVPSPNFIAIYIVCFVYNNATTMIMIVVLVLTIIFSFNASIKWQNDAEYQSIEQQCIHLIHWDKINIFIPKKEENNEQTIECRCECRQQVVIHIKWMRWLNRNTPTGFYGCQNLCCQSNDIHYLFVIVCIYAHANVSWVVFIEYQYFESEM